LGNSQTFASRLREERIRLCPKQLKFAELSGIDNTVLSALENGKQNIRADHLELLANAGIDILYVISGRRGGALLSEAESKVLDAYRLLDPLARDAFLTVAQRMVGGAAENALHQPRRDYRPG